MPFTSGADSGSVCRDINVVLATFKSIKLSLQNNSYKESTEKEIIEILKYLYLAFTFLLDPDIHSICYAFISRISSTYLQYAINIHSSALNIAMTCLLGLYEAIVVKS